MKFWRRRKPAPSEPKPDIEAAHAQLARIKAQRGDVEALVSALVIERHLNNFSANLTATFRGGRQ